MPSYELAFESRTRLTETRQRQPGPIPQNRQEKRHR